MNRKYIIPVAIVKLLLALLILHLFFSSCESDDIFYEASVYTEGPLLEVPASFGRGDQIYSRGDTIVLEIRLNDLNVKDAISGDDVMLNNPTFNCEFCFIDKDGVVVPAKQTNVISGQLEDTSEGNYKAVFGYRPSADSRYMSTVNGDLPYLRLEFIFDIPGDYVLYFLNTPNHAYDGMGGVDVFYNYVDGEPESQAYAVYYFEERPEQNHSLEHDVRYTVLNWSEREELLLISPYRVIYNERCFLHIILLTLAFNTIYAQGDYRPFKIDLGLLMGELPEHNVGLFAPYVEPKVNLSNQLTLGLRFEFLLYSKQDFIVYNPDDPYFSDFDADGWTFSAVFTSDYYFNDHFLRPFVGCGVGVYQLYNAKENSYLDFNEELVALGFVPRAGFNIGQFRISCEYNSILSEKTETNLSYFSLKLGFELGGKKKWF